MSPFDPREPPEPPKPPAPLDDLYSPRPGCVTVIVRQPPPAPPKPRRPELPEPVKPIVIRPPESPTKARDALVAKLVHAHGAFVLGLILSDRRGIPPQSAEDLAQKVLDVLTAFVEKHQDAPGNVRGYLTEVARNQIRNWASAASLDVDRDADADQVVDHAADPEGAAELVEQMERLQRYLGYLTEPEAAAYRCVVLRDMEIGEAATELKLPRGTVSTLVTRAKEKLADIALASERRTPFGRRRR